MISSTHLSNEAWLLQQLRVLQRKWSVLYAGFGTDNFLSRYIFIHIPGTPEHLGELHSIYVQRRQVIITHMFMIKIPLNSTRPNMSGFYVISKTYSLYGFLFKTNNMTIGPSYIVSIINYNHTLPHTSINYSICINGWLSSVQFIIRLLHI